MQPMCCHGRVDEAGTTDPVDVTGVDATPVGADAWQGPRHGAAWAREVRESTDAHLVAHAMGHPAIIVRREAVTHPLATPQMRAQGLVDHPRVRSGAIAAMSDGELLVSMRRVDVDLAAHVQVIAAVLGRGVLSMDQVLEQAQGHPQIRAAVAVLIAERSG